MVRDSRLSLEQSQLITRIRTMGTGTTITIIVNNTAYEFKLRVTIAASGQGRFSEELDFAEDFRQSDFNPILLVLDPTPSNRLQDLTREYARVGGKAYIGDAAWQHLEEQAGSTMSQFVEKYVRHPITELDAVYRELLNLSISNTHQNSSFLISLSNSYSSYTWNILRQEDEKLIYDMDESEQKSQT